MELKLTEGFRAVWLAKVEQMLCDLSLGASRTSDRRVPKSTRKAKKFSPQRRYEIMNAYYWFEHGKDYEGTCMDAGMCPDLTFRMAKKFVRQVEQDMGKTYQQLIRGD